MELLQHRIIQRHGHVALVGIRKMRLQYYERHGLSRSLLRSGPVQRIRYSRRACTHDSLVVQTTLLQERTICCQRARRCRRLCNFRNPCSNLRYVETKICSVLNSITVLDRNLLLTLSSRNALPTTKVHIIWSQSLRRLTVTSRIVRDAWCRWSTL